MKDLAAKAFQYTLLTVITAVACAVMWWSSRRDVVIASAGQAGTASPPAVAAPKALVTIADIRPQVAELSIIYSGKIRPWETYSLGFEIGGRVQELGTDRNGRPLDDGARVSKGQVLASLDSRILRARRSETVAQLEQATSDLRRARSLRDLGGQAITDAEYQEFLTALALAKAQLEMATKNLEDSALVSPVDGAISKRMVEAGESVNAHTMVFEIVENHDVLLVVDVPESQVRELELRMRAVRQAKTAGAQDESAVFRARVQLEGRNAFGQPWPPINAEVYRIAQVADARTGLFEVEIRIPNPNGLLRPGMVATAQIVTDRLLAYSIPENAVIFRDGNAFVYTLHTESASNEVMFWEVGPTQLQRAARIELKQWSDQGDKILVPAASAQLGPVVTRGQQRLADGQLVRVTNPQALPTTNVAARRLPETGNADVN